MASGPTEPSARTAAEAGTLMIEAAERSVVQVRSGSRGAGTGVIPSRSRRSSPWWVRSRGQRSVPLRVMRGGKISVMEVPLGEAGQVA